MPTLADLKTRIATQLNRDDMSTGGPLEAELAAAIADAVEAHAGEAFWFNRASGTSTTTANLPTLSPPSTMRLVLQVAYQGEPLRKVQLDEIEARTETGAPAAWAEDGDAILLWPIPNGAYALRLFGVAELGVPADGDENEWTTTAGPLILATAKKLLCRDTLRDPDGAALASQAEEEEVQRLRRETRRRVRQFLATDIPPARAGFNIQQG